MAGTPNRRAEREAAGLPVAPKNPSPAGGWSMTPYSYDELAAMLGRKPTKDDVAAAAEITSSAISAYTAKRLPTMLRRFDETLTGDDPAAASRLALTLVAFVNKASQTNAEPVVAEAHVSTAEYVDSE